MRTNERLVVSVWMITYNHEPYIAQAIEGVLMQKTTFSIELVIGEDCSTDNTVSIIKEYVKKNPSLIKARFNQPNMGMAPNMVKTLEECQGKYIAMCEGDDYWTDPYKLQKQVDFLEQNLEYSICGGLVNYFYAERNIFEKFLIPNEESYPKGRVVTLDNYMNPYILRTATICFRKEIIEKIYSFEKCVDVILFAIALERGAGFVFNEVFAVYRKHNAGVWTGLNNTQKILFDIENFKELYKHYHSKSKSIREIFLKRNFDLFITDYKLYKDKKNKKLTVFDFIQFLISRKSIGISYVMICKYLYVYTKRRIKRPFDRNYYFEK